MWGELEAATAPLTWVWTYLSPLDLGHPLNLPMHRPKGIWFGHGEPPNSNVGGPQNSNFEDRTLIGGPGKVVLWPFF